MDFLTKLRAVKAIGLGQALKAVANTFYKESLDRRYRPLRPPQTPFLPPWQRKKIAFFPGGAKLDFENAALEVKFLAPDLVRLSWEPGAPPLPYALARTEWPPVEFEQRASPEGILLSSNCLQVLVRQEGGLVFRTAAGAWLREELPPERQDGAAAAWIHRARLRPEERIYGLGERTAPLDRRGRKYEMWNTEAGGAYDPQQDPLYLCIPVYLGIHSDGSYLVFYENPCHSSFDFRGETAEARFEDGMLRYYLIAGPPQQALRRYSELTGPAPLPPRWALGYHQSRWGYKTAGDVRRVAAGFREHDLPLSAVHLDLDYTDGRRMFTFNREGFPDMASLSAELLKDGVRIVTILDPGLKKDPGYSLYRQGLEGELFCKTPDGQALTGVVWPGWTVFPDFTDPKARDWWGEKYRVLLEAGISGFWHDMNEPSSFAAFGESTFPLSTRHSLEGCGGDHRTAHNLYGLLMNRAGFEGLQKLRPERRPWIVSRSGWAGMQRYAWNWTGDTETSWAALRGTIPMVLGLGFSGIPYSGPDIGGFSGTPSAELYTRWFQLAAFLPFFRTHSAVYTASREPWSYGEPTTSIVREFLRLRYRLLPFWYNLAWQSSQTGIPLVRPLFWADPQDPDLWEIEDAFLLGDHLLVAPIVEEGAASRKLCLPRGSWTGFWDNRRYEGPGEIELEARLDRLPLLARAGSVIPMETDGRLELHVYPPGGDNVSIFERVLSGILYTDAGDGYGASRLDSFWLRRISGGLALDWESEGSYPFPYSEITACFHRYEVKKALADGLPVDHQGNQIALKPFHHLQIMD